MSVKEKVLRILKTGAVLYTLFPLLFFTSPSYGAASEVPQLENAILLDGVIQEEAWEQALRVDLTVETEPGNNTPAAFATTAYLLHSENSLYIAFDAKGDPNEIRAHLRSRDRIAPDDQVGVVIDAFADHSRAYMFFVTPGGVIYDALYHELTGDEESGWDGDWLSKARILEDGYQVEIKIPFNVMTLPGSRNVPMAIDLVRMIPRQERHRLSYVALQRGNNCYLCQLETFVFWPSLQSRRKTQMTFSQTSGVERYSLNKGDWHYGERTNNQSLEISHQTAGNDLISIAFNPDFSQVEMDDLIFDLNQQFSLFVPERRGFFLQHGDFYRSNLPLINTKNILDPQLTARYSQKSRDAERIMLYARDRSLRLLLPDSSYSSVYLDEHSEGDNLAARIRRNIRPNLSLGATGTLRSYEDYQNSLMSSDLKWRPNQHHELNIQWAGSLTSSDESELAARNYAPDDNAFGKAYYLRYIHSRSNWDLNLYAGGSSDEFRADLGFVPQDNFRDASVTFRYANYISEDKFLDRILFRTEAYKQKTWDGGDLSEFYSQSVTFSGDREFELAVDVGTKIQEYNMAEYKQPYQRVQVSYRPKEQLRVSASGYRGDRIDFVNDRLGHTQELDAGLTWRIVNRLELSANVNYWEFDSAGSRLFTANGLSFSGLYHFSNRAFLRLSVQNRRIERDLDQYVNPVGLGDKDKGTDWQLLFNYTPSNNLTFYAGITNYRFATELNQHDEENGQHYLEDRQYGFAKFSYRFDF